jgi:hypothetical protein
VIQTIFTNQTRRFTEYTVTWSWVFINMFIKIIKIKIMFIKMVFIKNMFIKIKIHELLSINDWNFVKLHSNHYRS